MRTLLFLVAGLLLLASFLILAKLFSSSYPGATRLITIQYILLWLIISGFNMWVGVAKAGYSIREELPILFLIFGMPVAAAILLKWKFL